MRNMPSLDSGARVNSAVTPSHFLRFVFIRIGQFFRLSNDEKGLFLKAWGTLWWMRITLWVLPFRFIRPLLVDSPQPVRLSSEVNSADVRKIVWAVSRTSRLIPKGQNCLLHALSTHRLLSRRGFPSRIQFGVNRDEDGAFSAHAWVELEGKVVMGSLPDLSQFIPLVSKKRAEP